MSPVARSVWFPELERLETRRERRALWRAAYRPVVRGKRYWLIAIASQIALQLAFRLAGASAWAAFRPPVSPSIFSGAAATLGAAVAGVLTLGLVRQALRRELRLRLNERALPTCLACGYDLRGAVARRCPECGVEIDRRRVPLAATPTDTMTQNSAAAAESAPISATNEPQSAPNSPAPGKEG